MHQRARTIFVAAALLAMVDCGHGDDTTKAAAPAHPAQMPTGSLAFDETDTLELALAEEIDVGVTMSPPSSSPVRFALLGDYADAALSSLDDGADLGTAIPDEQGHARIAVHAPTKPATFALRASIDGGPSVVRAIGASGDGFATVTVLPSYDGKRDSSQWTATAAAGQSCADHPELPVEDGPITATSQGSDPLVLQGVPVGATILVTLRSQHALSGCVDLAGLQVNEKRMLLVKAQNVPATLVAAPLLVTLSMTPDAATWPPVVTDWGARFRAGFLGGAKSLGAVSGGTRALLDTMALTFPVASAADFQSARAASSWDAHLSMVLGAGADPGAALEVWLAPALQTLSATPAGVTAALLPSASGVGTMTPTSLLGIDGASGDTLAPASTSLTVDGDDLLHVAGKLGFWPSRAVARVVSTVALSSSPGLTNVPEALGASVNCAAVASTLVAKGPGLAGCNGKCLASACTQALGLMWDRAASADEQAQRNGTLTFAASGALRVDGDAHALGFDGTWVGNVSDASSTGIPKSADAKGTATGNLAAGSP